MSVIEMSVFLDVHHCRCMTAMLLSRPLDKRLRAASILWAKDSPQYSRMHQGRGYRNMMNTSMYNTPDVIDRQGAWRDIQVPEIEDITALRVQNEALKAKLVELQASASATTSGSKL